MTENKVNMQELLVIIQFLHRNVVTNDGVVGLAGPEMNTLRRQQYDWTNKMVYIYTCIYVCVCTYLYIYIYICVCVYDIWYDMSCMMYDDVCMLYDMWYMMYDNMGVYIYKCQYI